MTPSSVLRSAHLLLASAPALALASLALAFACTGCGGTNSETPWPVEPEDVELGPEGETRTNESRGAPASSSGEKGGTKTAPKSKPAPKPAPTEEAPEAPRSPAPSTPSNPSTQF